MDTELEGGDSQNIEVITSNNDRIDVEDEAFKTLQYKKVGELTDNDGNHEEYLKVVSGVSQQVPLYNVFSPDDQPSIC